MSISLSLPGRTMPNLARSNRAMPDRSLPPAPTATLRDLTLRDLTLRDLTLRDLTLRDLTLRDLTLLHVGDGLWRVVNRTGAVLGHIERSTDGVDERFAARRLLAATRTMVVGTFWNIDDAAACFR
ncbi:hypothetical protein QMG61_12110 [Cryobacterium sp. PH31-AA6]|uniref:hypothetical protein n=1 Tax=Cryobacterium sp. PH31-AA6 TaxID=3046205 RepID=UPI0024BA97B1|nr:hypothetical protein [Cryobacterium sp. PH31-AA6]MDJ0324502.1 hypothetical protein [Cryobacterium sp. PH31-AA6]